MAAFRVLLLLALSTTLTRCVGAVDGDDVNSIVELINATVISTVIMHKCPVATEVLLACCLLLGAAIGVRTRSFGCGCFSCSFFYVPLFFPVFAFFVGQDSACDASESDAAFIDDHVKGVFVIVFLMFITYLGIIFLSGAYASFIEKVQPCCSCAKPDNDLGMAQMLFFMIVFIFYGFITLAIIFLFFPLFDATGQRVVCIVEVLLMYLLIFQRTAAESDAKGRLVGYEAGAESLL